MGGVFKKGVLIVARFHYKLPDFPGKNFGAARSRMPNIPRRNLQFFKL